MRATTAMLPLLLLAAAAGADAQGRPERRCGWVVNPTPGNWWLVDRDTRWNTGWLISAQGGYEARGTDNLPDMTSRGWVRTNGNYGYGCGCMTVVTDRRNGQITRIDSAAPAPLAQCRRDRRLPRPQN